MASRPPPPNPFGVGATPLSGVASDYGDKPAQPWKDTDVRAAPNMPTTAPTVSIKGSRGGKSRRSKRVKRKRSRRRL
jgi:hypothetical protein